LVPGGQPFAFALGVGFDLLNAWLDYTGSKPENRGKSDIGILSDMATKIADFIIDHGDYLPIIGGLKHFGMAYGYFKGGSIAEGLKELGLGIFGFMGGGAIIEGFQVLYGWLTSKDEKTGDLKDDKSWLSRLTGWIKSKLEDLPGWIAEPLRWFGILDDGGSYSVADIVSTAASDASKGVVDFVSNIWDTIKSSLMDTLGAILNKLKSVNDFVVNGVSNTVDKVEGTVGKWMSETFMMDSNDKKPTQASKTPYNKMGPPKQLKEYTSKQQNLIPDKTSLQENLLKGTESKKDSMDLLYKASMLQVKLLSDLVTIGGGSLRELRRMNGNSGGGGISIIPPSLPSPSKQMVNIPNNRSGYASSPYAL
jgi:hypothetical protein